MNVLYWLVKYGRASRARFSSGGLGDVGATLAFALEASIAR